MPTPLATKLFVARIRLYKGNGHYWTVDLQLAATNLEDAARQAEAFCYGWFLTHGYGIVEFVTSTPSALIDTDGAYHIGDEKLKLNIANFVDANQ